MDTNGFLVRRVPPPEWPVKDSQQFYSTFGGQKEWAWGLPGVFQALAAPRANAPVPQMPIQRDPMEHVLGYWYPLIYMLVYRLGWADPGKGLRAWIDAGRPTLDPTLTLIDEIWARDGELEKAVLWLTAYKRTFYQESQPTFAAAEPSRDWAIRAEQALHDKAPSEFDMGPSGGTDTLHVGMHIDSAYGGSVDDGVGALAVVDESNLRAVASFDSAYGWYGRLRDLGESLPVQPIRNWHVDVYVRPIGWMGEYRMSRVSERWFTGRHSIHQLGIGG